MRDDVTQWRQDHTSTSAAYPMERLLKAKADTTISVVLPALNEETTVGDIVRSIATSLTGPGQHLVDEIVVMDSGSTDDTAAIARAAGARVVARGDVLPRMPVREGKGEVLWRSLAASTGDLIVFVDADLTTFDPGYVRGLVGPLLVDPGIQFVKAAYERPLVDGGLTVGRGGRVTELVARPLINLHWPELAGLSQPLGGEYAARRTLLENLPFACSYGVELGLLVDTLERVGLDAIAEVDLGLRVHRHHDDLHLGRMASEIMQTALVRLDREGRIRRRSPLGTTLSQFRRLPDGTVSVEVQDVAAGERPPIASLPEYAAGVAKRRARTASWSA